MQFLGEVSAENVCVYGSWEPIYLTYLGIKPNLDTYVKYQGTSDGLGTKLPACPLGPFLEVFEPARKMFYIT